MRILLALLISIYTFQSLSGQTKERDSILKILENYNVNSDHKNLLKVSKQAQNQLKVKTAADSLYLAKLLYYESNTIRHPLPERTKRKLLDKIVTLCPNNHEGLVFKAYIIDYSAHIEVLDAFDILAYQKMEKALAILERLEEPAPFKRLHGLNLGLANYTLRLGEIEKYNNHVLNAEQIFSQNTFDVLSKISFYNTRIRQLNIENNDDVKLLNYINRIKLLCETNPSNYHEFHYAMAQVNVAEFYLKNIKKGNKKAAKKAYAFLDNVLSNKNDDRIMRYYKKTAWYTKNEVLLEENKFESALKSNTELINFSSPNEARARYHLYQRIKILLKLNRYKEANNALYAMINQFHSGSENLKPNYSNFETPKKLDYVSMFLDLSDAFKKFETKDVNIRKAVVSLNKLGLYQFRNSINNQLTTPKTRALFKRIIFNFIATKHYDLGDAMTTPEFLETIENIENTLDWQEFLQNRAYAKLPFITNYKYEEIALRDQLVQARIKKQDSTIVKLELQLDQLQKNFKDKYPNYSKLAFSDFSTADFQSKMKKGEVVLKYENTKDSLYTFVISKNDVTLLNIGYSKNISKSVKTYITNISERVNTDQLSKQLFEQIIPKEALAYNQINIVPDGYLFNLPFETLKNSSGNYLIEDNVILYAPYLSLFQHNVISTTSNKLKPNANLMIFTPSYEGIEEEGDAVVVRGNSYRLNGAKKESELLSNLFDNASFSNYSATKENFKAHAPEAQLLHLSMHADIDSETPELSYLLFTEGSSDNKLYIEELYGMNLKANMAVLSACNTGNVLNADKNKGIVSLHRAFTQAGVPTTVASLWSAPDNATQEIMVEFYRQLKEGKTKAKALQLAKLHYLKTTDDALLKSPFYWAGFIINGNDDAIITPNSNINYIVWFLLLVVIVILISLSIKKNRSLKNNF